MKMYGDVKLFNFYMTKTSKEKFKTCFFKLEHAHICNIPFAQPTRVNSFPILLSFSNELFDFYFHLISSFFLIFFLFYALIISSAHPKNPTASKSALRRASCSAVKAAMGARGGPNFTPPFIW